MANWNKCIIYLIPIFFFECLGEIQLPVLGITICTWEHRATFFYIEATSIFKSILRNLVLIACGFFASKLFSWFGFIGKGRRKKKLQPICKKLVHHHRTTQQPLPFRLNNDRNRSGPAEPLGHLWVI